MGYDLRITRAIDWTANRGVEISTPEWMAVVAADPELVVDPGNGPFAARFGATGWFDWFEGNIFTTDPTFATAKKMLSLAQQLSAVVQGDEGEFYNSANQWTQHLSQARSPGGQG